MEPLRVKCVKCGKADTLTESCFCGQILRVLCHSCGSIETRPHASEDRSVCLRPFTTGPLKETKLLPRYLTLDEWLHETFSEKFLRESDAEYKLVEIAGLRHDIAELEEENRSLKNLTPEQAISALFAERDAAGGRLGDVVRFKACMEAEQAELRGKLREAEAARDRAVAAHTEEESVRWRLEARVVHLETILRRVAEEVVTTPGAAIQDENIPARIREIVSTLTAQLIAAQREIETAEEQIRVVEICVVRPEETPNPVVLVELDERLLHG